MAVTLLFIHVYYGRKTTVEHVSVYLIAEAYKLFNILSPAAVLPPSLRPNSYVRECVDFFNTNPHHKFLWLYSMNYTKNDRNCTGQMVEFYKSCSNKFDTKHDNFIYERDEWYVRPIFLSLSLFSLLFASTIAPTTSHVVPRRWKLGLMVVKKLFINFHQ